MNSGKYVFAQLLQFVGRYEFEKSVKHYNGDYLRYSLFIGRKKGKVKVEKYYLFVAIDRATRTMYYKVYDAKTSEDAEGFMNECLGFFPFGITHVLTDNGLEFTNRLIKSKNKGVYSCKLLFF